MPEFVALPAATTTLKAALLAWYDRHKRELPWRGSSTKRVDPYHVMVSELMLQQTTVKTVKTRFTGFIERFPTVAILASAP
ncbi:MAG: A/G-specific adenine glycosylase, partial [Geminicoccaceae bacterium]|nr:A/G-specific adenine glycosylase [Geminicoccaceae bacterium]